MPLYEYECDACGHRFEKIQKFSDAPIETCPVCGGAVTKLFSSPAIQFKGSGFYITDYARAGKGDGANASAAKDGASTSSSESKASTESAQGTAESKADAKSDAAKKREPASDTTSESKNSERKKSESKTGETENAAPAASSAKSST